MKIKKVRKQEMVTKIFMINQNLKILHTASFFLFLNFSDHFLFPYFFNLHSILHFQYLHLF